jgi:hypothetical protein
MPQVSRISTLTTLEVPGLPVTSSSIASVPSIAAAAASDSSSSASLHHSNVRSHPTTPGVHQAPTQQLPINQLPSRSAGASRSRALPSMMSCRRNRGC